ncbi:MAG: hypothetical protein ACYC99_10935 [Candidatus Geothermincolia bacterium]
MKTTKRLVKLLLVAGLIVAWLQASDSTKRYLKHIGRQVPALPYRYFI